MRLDHGHTLRARAGNRNGPNGLFRERAGAGGGYGEDMSALGHLERLTHLAVGIVDYRQAMRRPWPKVSPVEDEDDEW